MDTASATCSETLIAVRGVMPEQPGHIEIVPLGDGRRHGLVTWSACACPLAALIALDNNAGCRSVDGVERGAEGGDGRIVLCLHRCDRLPLAPLRVASPLRRARPRPVPVLLLALPSCGTSLSVA